MKNTGIKTMMLIAIAIFLGTSINAQNPNGRGMGQDGRGMGPKGQGDGTYMKQMLDLTGEQEEQIKALKLEHYKAMKPFKAEMGELKARKKNLMSQEEVDVKAVNKVIDQQTDIMSKMQKNQVTHTLAFREILTDEQQMLLDQKRKHAGRMGQAKGARMNPRGYQKASKL